jgi:hypothetical protein
MTMSSTKGVRVVVCGQMNLCMSCFIRRYGDHFEQAFEGRGQVGVCDQCKAGRDPGEIQQQSATPMKDYEDQLKSFVERDSRWQYGPRRGNR